MAWGSGSRGLFDKLCILDRCFISGGTNSNSRRGSAPSTHSCTARCAASAPMLRLHMLDAASCQSCLPQSYHKTGLLMERWSSYDLMSIMVKRIMVKRIMVKREYASTDSMYQVLDMAGMRAWVLDLLLNCSGGPRTDKHSTPGNSTKIQPTNNMKICVSSWILE
jgi:hypothetical protein